MKIEETIERQCCKQQDLKSYHGLHRVKIVDPMFCIHCGQVWGYIRYTDEAGDQDSKRVSLICGDQEAK